MFSCFSKYKGSMIFWQKIISLSQLHHMPGTPDKGLKLSSVFFNASRNHSSPIYIHSLSSYKGTLAFSTFKTEVRDNYFHIVIHDTRRHRLKP